MVSPQRTTTEPSACFANLPVSIVIVLPSPKGSPPEIIVFNKFVSKYGRVNVSLYTTYDTDENIKYFFNQHLKNEDDFHILLTKSGNVSNPDIKVVMGVFKSKLVKITV